MVRRWIIWLLLLPVIGLGEVVYIGAAANTAYILPELIKEFQKSHPNYSIKPVVASSGKLTLQIRHGAPFQLFLSADMKYPETLYRAGFGAEPPKVYAYGLLAVATGNPQFPLQWEKLPTAEKVAIPNPEVAPYGVAAVEALRNSGLYRQVEGKLVYGESVTGTLNYILSGVPVGIVAQSLLRAPQLRRWHLRSIPVPRKYYHPIPQGVLLLKRGGEGAKAFYQFLFTPTAQQLFRKYGYLPPKGE